MTPPLPGVESLSISHRGGPGGNAMTVQLSHRDAKVLAAASEEVSQVLRDYSELKNVENGYAAGKRQLDFHLLPNALRRLDKV